MAQAVATDSLTPLNFRHRESTKRILEAFAIQDGHTELTPVLREAVDFYIDQRMRNGRDAVKSAGPNDKNPAPRDP